MSDPLIISYVLYEKNNKSVKSVVIRANLRTFFVLLTMKTKLAVRTVCFIFIKLNHLDIFKDTNKLKIYIYMDDKSR